MPGTGSTIGGIAGGIGGFVLGGPAGAMIGYGAGSALGGALDSQGRPTGDPRATRTDRVMTAADARLEEERQRQLADAQARGDQFGTLGRQLGADAYHGQTVAGGYQRDAGNRSNQLYGEAAGMYGNAAGTAADQRAVRGDTLSAVGRLRDFYEQGPGPSAAQAQLVQGQDAAARQAMSLAATGGGGAAARRAALRTSAVGNQQTNQAAGALRAQEAADWQRTKLSAMGQEQSALQGVRAGDVGVYGQQLGAAGQREGAALGAGQLGLGYGQLGAQYGQQGVAGQLGAAGLQAGQYSGGASNASALTQAGLQSGTSRYASDRGVQGPMAQVQQNQDAADRAFQGSLIAGGVGMLNQNPQNTGVLSDVRAKENIRPVSAANLVSRVDALQSNMGPPTDMRNAGSYSYDYKSPAMGPDNQVGPMAQELEHTAAAGAVSTGPDGMKSVDPGRLTMTNTAAIGEQQRRIDALEAMIADKDQADWQPKGAATQGQRTIRKTEGVEGRRMSEDEMRAMASFGHSGSLRPQDEEFIKQRMAGRVGKGNVDLYNQPAVKNKDGSISTVDSSSYNIDGQEVLLPSVTPDGRHLKTEDEIIKEYRKTGRHLGKFGTPQEADAYAQQLHNDYAAGKYGQSLAGGR